MRLVETGAPKGTKKWRLIVMLREFDADTPSKSRSQMMFFDENETVPDLDEMLEKAVNAVIGGKNGR